MRIDQVPRAYKLWWDLNYAAEQFDAAMDYITRTGDFEAAGQALRACGLAEPRDMPDVEVTGAEEQPGLFKKRRRRAA